MRPVPGSRRGGFALLTVLWVMLGATAVTLTGALAGRESVNAGRNRVLAERSYWLAHECEVVARAVIDESLLAASDPRDGAALWRALDTLVVRRVGSAGNCTVQLEAAGARLDVNAADSGALTREFIALGLGTDALSLTDAVLDWRDADDLPRLSGAERAGYIARESYLPRNAPFADVHEVSRVRGLEAFIGIDRFLTAEPGRIALNSARPEVLRAIPGFGDEAIEHLMQMRTEGRQVADLLDFGAELSADARDAIIAHFPDIVRMATVDPEAWILTARASSGRPVVEAMIELRLVRTGSRAAVIRRRSR